MNRRKFLSGLAAAPAIAAGAVVVAKAAPSVQGDVILSQQITPYGTSRNLKALHILNSRHETVDNYGMKVWTEWARGSQWTPEQIAILKKRGQPLITFNRIGRA